jgi:hypothetical protein
MNSLRSWAKIFRLIVGGLLALVVTAFGALLAINAFDESLGPRATHRSLTGSNEERCSQRLAGDIGAKFLKYNASMNSFCFRPGPDRDIEVLQGRGRPRRLEPLRAARCEALRAGRPAACREYRAAAGEELK